MSAVQEILTLIRQLETDKGQKPTRLELHPDYYQAVCKEMEATVVAPSDTVGTWLNGVQLVPSERVKEMCERN